MDAIEQAIDEELMGLNLQPSENDSEDESDGDSATDSEGNLQVEDELPDSVLTYVEASRSQMNALEQLILEEVEEKDVSSLDLSNLIHNNNTTNEPALDFMDDPIKWKEREQVALMTDMKPQEPDEEIPNMLFMEDITDYDLCTELSLEWKEVEEKLKKDEQKKLAAQEVEREMQMYSEREDEKRRRRRLMEFEEELKKTENATMTNEVHHIEDLQLELEKQQNSIRKLEKQVEEEKRVFKEAQEKEKIRTQKLQCKAATKIQAFFRGTLVRCWSKTELLRRREEKKRHEEEEKRELEKIKKEREEERKRIEEEERTRREEMERRRADYERAKAQERHRLEKEQRLEEQRRKDEDNKERKEELNNITCVKDDCRRQEEDSDREIKEKQRTEVESGRVDGSKTEENKDNEVNVRKTEDKNKRIKQETNIKNKMEDNRTIIIKHDKMESINTEGLYDTRPQTKCDKNRIRSHEEEKKVDSNGDLDSPSQSRKANGESHIKAHHGFSNQICISPLGSSSVADHPSADVNPSINTNLTVPASDLMAVAPDVEALNLSVAAPEMDTRGHQNPTAVDPEAREPKIQESVSMCLPDSTEQKRLAWMMSCTPWSKLSLQNKRKGCSGQQQSQRAPRNRRAPSLPPLSEDLILKTGVWNSLRQVTTVTLEDLPGCSLSKLSECHKLQTLTLRRCGLTCLDGLSQCVHIRYIDVQENSITHVDCGGLSSLQVLLLGRNQLMNIHGLDGAENLQVLQLSHNNISRISGLGPMKKLLRLSVDHNQLLSTRGLKEIYTLLDLDCSYNHLSHIEGLENCAVLNTLDLRGNSLTELPVLQNHVLLRDLYLDDNLISSIHDLESYWLPLLQNLSMAQNSVTHLIPLLDLVSLRTLNISHNCLSDLQNVCLNLQECTSLQELNLIDNPLQQETNWRSMVLETVPGLIRLNNEQMAGGAVALKAPGQQWSFQALCQAHQEQRDSLLQPQKMEIRSSPSQHDSHLLAIRHQAELFKLAVDQRYAHEYGDSCVTEDPTVAATAFSGSSGISEASVSQEQSSEKQPQRTADWEESHLELQSSDFPEMQSEKEPVQELNLKIEAAVVIQRLWRRRCMLQRHEGLPGLIEKTNRKSDLHKVEETRTGHPERERAAIVIQAVWRGCVLRKRLARALAAAQITESDEDFEEVDMDEFIFDERELEKDWITLHSKALPARMMPFLERPPLPKSPPPLPMPPQSVFPREPKHAWSEIEDVSCLEQSVSPNFSSRSVIKKNILSEKTEQILKEWGFTNDSTGLLMLKRANKMKGRKQQKRLLDSNQRLALFRSHSNQYVSAEAQRQTHPTLKDNYKDHQAENEVHKSLKVQEKQTYKERSYQWLHTQAVHTDTDHTDTGRGHFLPDIGYDIVNGGRVQLVATGDRDAVDSGSRVRTDSTGVSPPFRKQSQARRYSAEHKNATSPTRVNSAPTRNERISFRDNPVRLSGGWGGGKKRARLNK